MSTIALLLSLHKSVPLLSHPAVIPFHTGRSIMRQKVADALVPESDLKWLREHARGDDEGENISHLNPQLNELTGIYWAWKHYEALGNPDYIGLMHYRRFFMYRRFTLKPLYVFLAMDKRLERALKLDDMMKVLNRYDFVAPKRRPDPLNNYDHYKKFHEINDLDMVLSILKSKYPAYSDVADEYMQSKKSFNYNMFIMKKELFFAYCDWLFGIVFEFQRLIDVSARSPENQRAFFSERLTGIYLTSLQRQGCRLLELPVAWVRGI